MKKLKWSTEKEFAEFIKDLLLYRGFKIDSYYDDIGPDGGRDIEAHTFEYDSALDELDSVSWWIELKYRSKSSLGAKDLNDIFSKITRAAASGVDKFLIITNTQFTPDFKDKVNIESNKNHIKVRFWDIVKLTTFFQKKEMDAEKNEYSTGLISDRLEDTKLIFNTIQSGVKSVFLLVGAAGVGKSALSRYIMTYISKSKSYLTGIIDLQIQGGIGLQLKLLAENFQRQNCISDFSISANVRKDESARINLLFDHCCKNKTLLVIDNLERQLDINGEINNPYIKQLVEKFLNYSINESVLLLLSRIPLKTIYSTQTLFFQHELKGWDIDFVYEKYLPYLQYLNTCISNISDIKKRKKLLSTMEGNPLALKIANQLCVSYSLEDIINCISVSKSPAQSLIKQISEELRSDEIEALNKFAQFSRPMTRAEVRKYICSDELLNRLRLRMLVEPLSNSTEQYQMHPLTIAQFDLNDNILKKKEIVFELVETLSTDLKNKNIEDVYNHGLLRQMVDMFLSVNEINHAAEIIIRIGTRVLSMGDEAYLKNILNRLIQNSQLKDIYRTRLKKVEGHIHDFNGRYDLEEKTYKNMLKESLEIKDPWSRAAALNGLGSIERYNNNCDKAISLYTESLQIRIDNNYIIDQSNSWHNLGAVYTMMEDYQNAIKCLKKAKSIREKANDIFRISATELYLGECYIHTHQFKEAAELLDQCIKNKEDIHDVVGYIWGVLAKAKLNIYVYSPIKPTITFQDTLKDLENVSRYAETLSHAREYVIAHIFLATISLFLHKEMGNVLEYLVLAKNKVNDTLLVNSYSEIINKLITLTMNKDLTMGQIHDLQKLILTIKI